MNSLFPDGTYYLGRFDKSDRSKTSILPVALRTLHNVNHGTHFERRIQQWAAKGSAAESAELMLFVPQGHPSRAPIVWDWFNPVCWEDRVVLDICKLYGDTPGEDKVEKTLEAYRSVFLPRISLAGLPKTLTELDSTWDKALTDKPVDLAFAAAQIRARPATPCADKSDALVTYPDPRKLDDPDLKPAGVVQPVMILSGQDWAIAEASKHGNKPWKETWTHGRGGTGSFHLRADRPAVLRMGVIAKQTDLDLFKELLRQHYGVLNQSVFQAKSS